MAEKPEVPTSSHFTSPEKATPRPGQVARGGVSRVGWLEADPGWRLAILLSDLRPFGPSVHARRGPVPGGLRRQTSISLQAVGAGRSRHLPYDYVLGRIF